MKLIKIQPTIHKFEKFSEFSSEFKLSEKDVIVVNDSIFNKFIKELNLNSIFISPKKYGTGEPSDEIIDNVIKEAAQYQYDRVVAIGGGAVMDIAKFLVLDGLNDCLDVFESKVEFNKTREFVAIPTTCGTGSEVTAISVAEIKSKNTKMGTAIPEFLPDHAVLIPELLKDMPYKVFAFSTLDALVHASESFVSPNSNPYTELFAEKAIELILKGYLVLREKGKEYYSDIIEDFLIGSNYAGIAFGNTGVGAVHALAYPLGANYHVAHGECNYEFFTPVFKKYNDKAPEGKIKVFNCLVASILGIDEKDVYAELDELFNFIWEKQKLNAFGMTENDIVEFADSVADKQQRLLANNYVPLPTKELADVYRETF
ncbi:4-hydroxybutyrate dehydrogenase [Vibrio salinus]|uniref:4-hydroxybutyrate dehydrogenase n=1 Tax=Vibrio salinus TaxID=2899784 RepID=UPI001E598CBC|nr:4-hydroxybutyrate dehydrogenase [Vibrio salinus]MCE0495483.1 4-hydroxybutyrate dehydrogenase [Vibrio salinus]